MKVSGLGTSSPKVLPECKLEAHILALQAEELSSKRRRHIAGVVAVSIELAQRFGVEAQRAALAALLHDHCREWKPSRLLDYALGHDLPVSFAAASSPMLLHGPVAAHLFAEKHGMADPQLLHAVSVHTVGCENPDDFDLLLMAADFMEPSRKYMNKEIALELQKEPSLEALVLHCLRLKQSWGKSGNELLRKRMHENLELRLESRLAK